MRKLALIVFTVGLLLATSKAASACSCKMPTVAQALRGARAVFLGEVVAIEFGGVIFKVKKSWKDADAPEVKVYVKGVGTSCDPGVEKGATMLVYAYGGTKGPPVASYCARTRALRQTDEEIKELDDSAVWQHRAKPNNGMHPTTDTNDFIYINRAGRRVMPGVRLLPYKGS